MKNSSYFKIIIATVLLVFMSPNVSVMAQFTGGGTATNPFLILSRADMDSLVKYVETSSAWTTNIHFKLMADIGSATTPWTKMIGIISSDNSHIFQGHFDGNNKTIYLNISNPSGSPTGLFTKVLNGSIKKLVISGTVAGASYNGTIAGGIVGEMQDGTLEQCVNKANVSAYSVGGIVGSFYHISEAASIINCKDSGTVSGVSVVGGIVGVLDGTSAPTKSYITVSNCYNFGNVSASTGRCGGICGVNHDKSIIINNVNLGRVSGNNKIGGIVGENFSAVSQSINLGIISGVFNIGGIVGANNTAVIDIYSATEINNCMNAGIVRGDTAVGGICGEHTLLATTEEVFGSADINYSLNVGCVESAESFAGGIVGIKHSKANVAYCYYDKQLTQFGGIYNTDVTNSAEGKYTNEMIGTLLNSVLPTNWNFIAGKYPMITGLSTSNYAAVASSPANFDISNTRTTLNKHFTVSMTNDVFWNATFNKVNIANGNVTLVLISNDTINCVKGDARKRIPIYILSIPLDKSFEVIVQAWPEEGGLVTGGGIYSQNDSAIITATANLHYTFSHWEELPSGIFFSSRTVDTVKITRDHTFRAHFIIDSFMLRLTAKPDTMGGVVGDGRYPYGAITDFWATPKYGYHFVNWTDENNAVYTDDIKGNIEIVEDRHLTAHFEIDTFNIKVSVIPHSYGTASVNNKEAGDYIYLTKVQIKTTGNDTCNHFVKWTALDDTTTISTDPNFDLTIVCDTHIVAHYTETKRILTLKADPPEAVTDLKGAGEYPCHPAVADVDFTMVPSGYRFVNWTDSSTGAIVSIKKDFRIEVAHNYTLIANFLADSIIKHIVNLMPDPENSGEVVGSGIYDPNQLVSIKAIPNPDLGYKFVNWQTLNNVVVSNQAEYSFNVTQDTTLIAHFSNTLSLSTSVYPSSEMGSITGTTPGVYAYNYPVSLTAVVTDDTSFIFVCWSNAATGGDTLSKNLTLDFALTSDTNIVAIFDLAIGIKEAPTITNFTLSPNPATDKFNISMELLENVNISISLVDNNGYEISLMPAQFLQQGNWNKEFIINHKPTGSYYIKLVIGNKSYYEKLIIEK